MRLTQAQGKGTTLTHLKGTVHKGLIQVNDHADPALILLCHLGEQAGPRDLIKLVLETLEQIGLGDGVGLLLVCELSGRAGLDNMLSGRQAHSLESRSETAGKVQDARSVKKAPGKSAWLCPMYGT